MNNQQTCKQKITIGTVCFLIDKTRQKVLLLHRANDPMKGLWTGVGGKTDFSEDIHRSCHREVFEETGIEIPNLFLKGVLKTVMEDGMSSWILFVYTADCPETAVRYCNEGQLEWVPIQEMASKNLIGFIREIVPDIFEDQPVFEKTIVHDAQGHVLS
jgi:8-oxo-dGTP diphosphatase